MPHFVGERLRCDECGAEIVYTKPCLCPEREPQAHSNLCCSQEMRILGVEAPAASPPAQAAHFSQTRRHDA